MFDPYPTGAAGLFAGHARHDLTVHNGRLYEAITCPYCLSESTEFLGGRVQHGYSFRTYFCENCKETFEQRSEINGDQSANSIPHQSSGRDA